MGFFSLTSAIDKEEALELIKNNAPYDLLLCDQHLPDGLGIELIEQAYSLGGIRHAILFSGIDTVEGFENINTIARARNLPLLMCMCKPLSSVSISRAFDLFWNKQGLLNRVENIQPSPWPE